MLPKLICGYCRLKSTARRSRTKDKAALRLKRMASNTRVADIEKALLQNKEFENNCMLCFSWRWENTLLLLLWWIAAEKRQHRWLRCGKKCRRVAASVLNCMALASGILFFPRNERHYEPGIDCREKAQANIIMRREETVKYREFAEHGKTDEENAILWSWKEMEYVERSLRRSVPSC